MTRPMWKWFYRKMRICTREAEKVALDTIIYGTGYCMYPNDGDPQHIPAEKVMIKQ